MADLIIEDVVVGGTVVSANGTASGTFTAGSQFSVTFDVRNSGTTSAGTSTAAAYMNVNGTLTRLDTNPTSSLSAGSQDTNETLSFTIPASLSPGFHAIVIQADDNRNVSETNESNNGFGFTIQLDAPRLPDLIIEDVTVGTQSISQNSVVSSAFAAGHTVSATFDVRNQGSGNAAASTAAAYLIVDGAAKRMDTETVSSITAGSQDTNETLSFSLPTDISPGNYGVIIVADDGDAVTESGGNNNSLGFVISVQRNTAYTLTPNTTSVNEGGKVSFTITRTGDQPQETVYFSTLTDGTATYAGGDYRMDTGAKPENIAVSFNSGQASKSVTLDILAGDGADSPETFRAIVQRNPNDGASVYLDRSSFVTINEVAQGTTYTLTPNTTSASEGGKVTYTITRAGGTPAETVYFSTLTDGTATFAEGDYRMDTGAKPENIAVSFTAGQTTKSVTLDILAGDGADSPETFRAIVQRNPNEAASVYLDRSSFVTINEAALTTSYSLSPNTTSAIEGGKVIYTITRTGDTPSETLYFSTKSNTASYAEGDYRLEGGGRPENVAVKFGLGDKVQTVTLDILSGDGNDSPENFSAVVERRVGSRFVELANSATVAITEQKTFVLNDTGKAIDPNDPSFLAALKDLGTDALSWVLKMTTNEVSAFTTTATQVTPPNTENPSRPMEIYMPVDGLTKMGGNWVDVQKLGGNEPDLNAKKYHLGADINSTDGDGNENAIHGIQSGKIIYAGYTFRDRDGNGVPTSGKAFPNGDGTFGVEDSRFGNTIVIEHEDASGKFYSLYGHLESIIPKVPWGADPVQYDFSEVLFKNGKSYIGEIGNTGAKVYNEVTGVINDIAHHLHLEIFRASSREAIRKYLIEGWIPLKSDRSNIDTYVMWGYTGIDIFGDKSFTSKSGDHWITWFDPITVINDNIFPGSSPTISPDKTVVSQISTSSPIAPKFVGQVNFDTANSTIASFIGSDGNVIADVLSGSDKKTSWIFEQISKLKVLGGSLVDKIFFSNIQKSSVDQNTILVDGDAGNDVIDGTFSGRHISARGGADDDTLTGGNSPDDLFGDDGNDMLQDSFGNNLLNGGAGNDKIAAHTGKSELLGEGDDDLLVGGIAGDILDGGTGSDVLIGDILVSIFGSDILSGGAGNDLLSGGGGSDTFIFRPNEGTDMIATFAIDYATPSNSAPLRRDFQADIDILDLRAFGYLSTDDAMSKFKEMSGSTVFTDQGTTVNFYGLTLADFSDFNFLLG